MTLVLYLSGGGLIGLLMTLLWGISLLRRDSSIVDVFWGIGFVSVAWFWAALTAGTPERKALILLLVTCWGLRLCLYLAWRNWGKGEDFRYRHWRSAAGAAWWWRSYLQVFLLQGVVMWGVSLPLLLAQTGHTPLALWDGLCGVLWAIGFGFEAVGDWQLARFKAHPANRGQVMMAGLWRYTRHPNYFGDALQWWAFGGLALAAGGGIALLSSVLMTFLLVRVSGVALLEPSLRRHKPGYQDYVARTSAFFPLPPRRQPPQNG